MKKQCFKAIAVLLWLLLINLSSLTAQTIPQPTPNSTPLLRYYNNGSQKSVYTTNHNEFGIGSPPNFVYVELVGWLLNSPSGGGATVYRYRRPSTGTYRLSKSTTPPAGYVLEGAIGWELILIAIQYPVYEHYNEKLKDYYYTMTAGYVKPGYVYTGIAFYATIAGL